MGFQVPNDSEGEFRGLRSRRRSRWWIYLDIFGGWLITLIIVFALWFFFYFYSEVLPIMSRTTKREFNTVITGLSIALSITVLKGLNGFVATLRWWILSSRYHSLRKIDLILQAESASRVIRLAVRTSRLSLHAAAMIWLSLILAVQIALALLGLCYSVETHDSMALVVQQGKVLVPDMSSIQTIKMTQGAADSLEAQQYTANSYGQTSLAFDTVSTEKIPDVGSIWTASDPLMFCDAQHCAYVFHETSDEPTENNGDKDNDSSNSSGQEDSLVVTTDRKINSTAVCTSWQVISGGNGTETRITVDTNRDGTAEEILIPIRGGVNQTTFMTNTSENCGAGCSTVTAFEAANAQSWYYRCNVTVSHVGNVTKPEHEVSESLRSMAAAAIALQGVEVSSLDSNEVQYQVYPAEAVFGVPTMGHNESIAMIMARFAIGTIAICAQSNDALEVDGFAPTKGSHLIIDHWDYITLILVSVTFAQLVLAVATAVVAERVAIPEGGPVAIARVLSPITNRLQNIRKGESSIALVAEGSVWIYKAVKTSEKGIYDLFFEEMVRPENKLEKM